MKALSLTQPWATLVAIGAKKIETRSWTTAHRGLIAVHAAKGFPVWAQDECMTKVFSRALWPDLEGREFDGGLLRERIKELPRGAVIATADIVLCKPTGASMFATERVMPAEGTPEHAFGDYSPRRFMWFLEDVRPLAEPIPCRGALGLWDVPGEVEAEVRRQLTRDYTAIAVPEMF